MKTAEEYRREMESYFGEDKAGEEPRPEKNGAPINVGSMSAQVASSPRPVLRLHDYARNPLRRSQAEGKLKEQKGLCAWSKSEGGVCDGSYFELDHRDGDPKNEEWENLQLLCEHHHRIKTNLDRKKARRSQAVSVKKRQASADRATWTSKEGQKAEWSRPEFDNWIANPQTWLELGRKTGMDLKIGEPAYLADLLDFGADSIIDPDYPEGVSQETLRRYVNARRFSTLRIEKLGHRRTVRFVGSKESGVSTSVQEGITAAKLREEIEKP